MSNLDGGLPPFSPLSGDPGAELKGKGVPWPVYLAIGLAVAGAIGFVVLRSYKGREKRKVHVAFMETFADFEKNDVAKFWRCLFNTKDADARRFNTPDQMTAQLEQALMTDPKNFPEKVNTECIPMLAPSMKKMKDFTPVPPADYDAALDKYSKALGGLANAFTAWGEGAPKRVESQIQLNKITSAGSAWQQTGNPKKPDPDALRFDRFMRCAVPDLDKMKDGQALLEFLAGKCVGKKTDPAFLDKLRDKCIPEAQEAPAKAPPTFGKVLEKLGAEYDREDQAWGSCFRSMRKASKKDDLAGVARAWTESVNAGTEVRKVGAALLKDE
jgi:hypothetical protein